MNLVPTASTTAALALGDALAMTLLVRKGFREEEFASFHPGGKLGRRLLRVENAMHGGEAAPIVSLTTPMPDVIHEMSSKRLGMTCVVDDERRLAGVITDGDLRRLMSRTADVLALTRRGRDDARPVTIPRALLAVEALNIMEARKITSIVVVDDHGLRRGRRAPPRSVADADGLIAWPFRITRQRMRLLLFDVDGVLTDGVGRTSMRTAPSRRAFTSATGPRWCGRSAPGLQVGLLSARSSPATAQRAAQLGDPHRVARAAHKADAYDRILQQAGLERCRGRLHGRRSAGSAGAGAGRPVGRAGRRRARGEARGSHWVSHANGGRGAVRELIELVLRAQDRWDAVVQQYSGA